MPRFELKKYHRNMGHEGKGFACGLWMDGALAAHMIRRGRRRASLVPVGESGGCVEGSRPPQDLARESLSCRSEARYQRGVQPSCRPGEFIWDLVAAHLEDKRTRRAAKTKLLFKLKSDAGTDVAYRTLKTPYSEQAAEFVRKKYGDDLLEIINETLAKE